MPTAVAGRQDPRAGDVAGVDRVAEGDLEVPERARAAGRRHAGAEGRWPHDRRPRGRSRRRSAGGWPRSSPRSDRRCSGRGRRSGRAGGSCRRRRSWSSARLPGRRRIAPGRAARSALIRSPSTVTSTWSRAVSARPSMTRTSRIWMRIGDRVAGRHASRSGKIVDNPSRDPGVARCGRWVREASVTTRRVGDAIVEVLRSAGVDTVFGIPGIHTLPLYDALAGAPAIRHILTRHEQGAAFAADGYARVTGRPGRADDDHRARARSTRSPRSPRRGRTRRRSSCWPARSTRRSTAWAAASSTRRPTRAGRSRWSPRTSAGRGRPRRSRRPSPRRCAARWPAGRDRPTSRCRPTSSARRSAARRRRSRCRAGSRRTRTRSSRPRGSLDGARRVVLMPGAGVQRAGASGELRELAIRLGAPVATAVTGAGSIAADDDWCGRDRSSPSRPEWTDAVRGGGRRRGRRLAAGRRRAPRAGRCRCRTSSTSTSIRQSSTAPIRRRSVSSATPGSRLRGPPRRARVGAGRAVGRPGLGRRASPGDARGVRGRRGARPARRPRRVPGRPGGDAARRDPDPRRGAPELVERLLLAGLRARRVDLAVGVGDARLRARRRPTARRSRPPAGGSWRPAATAASCSPRWSSRRRPRTAST